ncbi:DHHW protein [Ruminococcus sp. YE71]|uniref:DHHW family protein n=1 Tax=unclassified Ruminococcus TaxID=2608920 RepID=UPI00088E8A8E|nr:MULTISPECIES: DHHW family protein [unclassified Ruminococcus]SDA23661.1 DHHW protein [Ruminococcus sp. YE78]SFW40226.1 DHHW protein [Ruminococcus sp. YE71]
MKKRIFAVTAAAMMLAGCADARKDDGAAAAEKAAPETSVTTAETTTTTTTTTLVSTSAPPDEDSPYGFESGCIVAYQDTPWVRAMEEFYFSEETGDYLAQSIDSYAEKLDGVNTYLMMIPTSQEFYTPVEIKDDYPDQAECADYVYSKLKTAKSVPIDRLLGEHKAEYLYSRTDYHWQPIAAFYAAREFAEKAGVPFPEFSTYQAVEREGYLGAFYSVNGIYQLEDHPDTFTYYKPANLGRCKVLSYDTWFSGEGYEGSLFFEDMDIGSSYTVFVGTDDTILEIDTDVNNDRVLVVFKDSYGNALLPFLTGSFSKIYLCDDRFFNTNSLSFAKEVGATDILYALGAASTSSYEKVSLIEQNMYR